MFDDHEGRVLLELYFVDYGTVLVPALYCRRNTSCDSWFTSIFLDVVRTYDGALNSASRHHSPGPGAAATASDQATTAHAHRAKKSREAMLLAKLKELEARRGDGRGRGEGADGGDVDGPAAPTATFLELSSFTRSAPEKNAASTSSSTSGGGAGALGWAKTRTAGTKAARQAIRGDDRGLQTEPDGVVRRLRGHAGPVHCLVLSAGDQRRLYSGGRDGTVRAWDHLDDEGTCVLVMSGHDAAVCALAVDPTGGNRLYSAGADNTVRVWALTDGSCLRSSNLFEMTHADLTSYHVAPQRAYSHTFAMHRHKVYAVSLSHDAQRCFAGCSDKDVKVWDTKTGTLKTALKGHEGPVGAMAAFHTSSTRLLTGSGDATLRAWDLARSRCDCVMEGHSGPVLAVAMSADDRRVYSASSDNSVRIWEVRFTEGAVGACRGECLRVMHNCHRGNAVRCLAVSKPGSLSSGVLFTGGEDARVRVWRGDDSEALCSLKGHTDWVSAVVIDDRNATLCSASLDGSILVWRVGRVVRKELVFSEAASVFLDLRK